MEHNEAVRLQAAARYVAGELTAEEQEAFEDHFFDCRNCAEEVRFEHIFAANARAVSRETPEQHPVATSFWDTWFSWMHAHPLFPLSLAFNAVLAVGFGYVLITANRIGGPRFIPSYFAAPPSRALEAPKPIPPGTAAFIAHFPAPDKTSPFYSYEILDASGKRQSSGTLATPASPDQELYLEVPLKGLPTGVHTLVIHDSSDSETIARFQFQTST